MQLMIDISAETPTALRLAAEFLLSHAALREAMEGTSDVPTGTQAPAAPPAPAAPSNVLPFAQPAASPAPPAPPAPTNLPPVPPLPNTTTSAPAAATPDTSAAASPSSVAPVLPGVSGAPPADEERDEHGVPFDARIHQKTKGKKKDGTWKLQKGIAETLVSSVMQELAPRIRKTAAAPAAPPAPPAPAADPAAQFGQTPLPAGASAPVPLPPVPPIPGQAQAPIAPPAPPAGQAETVAPQADPFRALVKKVTEARTAKRITAEEVTQCAAAAGVPGLQALNAMPHLIATVEANIDALLASR